MELACDYGTDDYYPNEFYNKRIRKAAKQHKCCECYSTIEPGEMYEYVTGVWDGQFYTFKTCYTCSAIRDDLMPYCPHEGLKETLVECFELEWDQTL